MMRRLYRMALWLFLGWFLADVVSSALYHWPEFWDNPHQIGLFLIIFWTSAVLLADHAIRDSR